MEPLARQISDLEKEVNSSCSKSSLPSIEKELEGIEKLIKKPDFWSDSQRAGAIMKQQSNLKARLEPWLSLKKDCKDLTGLAELNDHKLEPELKLQLEKLSKLFEQLKKELRFNGPYDDLPAIISIYAGAGGTDAQDWAGMLLRMYLRYAEARKYNVSVLAESMGEEAGIKSATIEIDGPLVYGKLKGEHGVHRLVRLSPFNADSLRQTSFAKVEVTPKIDRPEAVQIDDKDLKIDVYRSGGKGGQSVNTTDSAVRITHLPTGITVAIQNERSQLQNRETAMTILRSRLAQMQLEQHKTAIKDLKGINQSAEWGNQIRNYVLHPYKMVKDLRSGHESSDPDAVLDGQIDDFLENYIPESS